MSGTARRADPDRERIAIDRTVIQISRPVHKRLAAIKAERERDLSRRVSFTEVIELLLKLAGEA